MRTPGSTLAPASGAQLAARVRARWTALGWTPSRRAVFILTGLLAGLRWGESAALRRSDIDWTRGGLTISRTVSDRGRRIEPCKDHEIRHVKASPVLLGALRAHVDAMTLEGQVREWDPEARALVFPTTYGNILHYPYFLTRVWRPLLSKAGLPYRRYHATRHTYAVALGGRRRPPMGAVPARTRQRRSDRRHLRARSARPP